MSTFLGVEIGWMRKSGRIALYSFAGLFVAGWVVATIWQILLGSYPDAAAEILVFAYLFMLKFYWPLWAAGEVRKRGGAFGLWFAVELILGIIIGGIIFAAVWARKPKLGQNSGESQTQSPLTPGGGTA